MRYNDVDYKGPSTFLDTATPSELLHLSASRSQLEAMASTSQPLLLPLNSPASPTPLSPQQVVSLSPQSRSETRSFELKRDVTTQSWGIELDLSSTGPDGLGVVAKVKNVIPNSIGKQFRVCIRLISV